MNNHNGEKYGRLTIIGKERRNGITTQKCLCDCGKITFVRYDRLKNGHTKSCGCLKKKHDIRNKRLYNCWHSMKARCNLPNRKDSKYYHDKGITYCTEWESFENFQDWALLNGYADNLTLDRVDGNKPYCPENCRWITIQEQQKNRSFCHYFTYNGETKILSEWAREFNIPWKTLSDRIFKFGYSFEEALSLKYPRNAILFVCDGETYSQKALAKKYGISATSIVRWRKKGYSADQIITLLKTGGYKHGRTEK